MNSIFPFVDPNHSNNITSPSDMPRSAFTSVGSTEQYNSKNEPNNLPTETNNGKLNLATALASLQAQLNLAALMQSWSASLPSNMNLITGDPNFMPAFPSMDLLRNSLNSPLKTNCKNNPIADPPSESPSTSSSSAPSSPPNLSLRPPAKNLESSPISQRKRSSQNQVSKSEQKTSATGSRTAAPDSKGSPTKRARGVRRLTLTTDHVTNSPVSGMHIMAEEDMPICNGTIGSGLEMDDTAKYVDISEESRAALACIPNTIGDYICRLCKVKFSDAVRLAQHRCPRIVHEEYRCPECAKVFSCPANLASHRRWHKPKVQAPTPNPNENSESVKLGVLPTGVDVSNEPEKDQPLNLMIQKKI